MTFYQPSCLSKSMKKPPMVKSTYIKVPMITYCYHHNSLFSTAILPSIITPISLLFLPLTSPFLFVLLSLPRTPFPLLLWPPFPTSLSPSRGSICCKREGRGCGEGAIWSRDRSAGKGQSGA